MHLTVSHHKRGFAITFTRPGSGNPAGRLCRVDTTRADLDETSVGDMLPKTVRLYTARELGQDQGYPTTCLRSVRRT